MLPPIPIDCQFPYWNGHLCIPFRESQIHGIAVQVMMRVVELYGGAVDAEAGGKSAPKLPKRIGNMMSDQWILGIRHLQKPTNIYTWMDWYANCSNSAACSCGILGFSWASSCWVSGFIAAFRSPPGVNGSNFSYKGRIPWVNQHPCDFQMLQG